ncbi:hypothetical protein [Pseudoalteromonas pernae]|uniref:hypothetical protein n=1 Tax=Pseudoalteromonas pernae TaxID=3118054 RepID=UPI003241C77E
MFFRTILISLLLHLIVLWLLLRTPTPAVMHTMDVAQKNLKVVMITLPTPQPVAADTPRSEVEIIEPEVNVPELQNESGEKSSLAQVGERQSSPKPLSNLATEPQDQALPASQIKSIDIYTNLEQRVASAYAQSQVQVGQYKALDQLPHNTATVPKDVLYNSQQMKVLAGDVVSGNYRFEQNGRCFVMLASSPMSDSDMPAGEVPCADAKGKKQAALNAAMDKWLK